MNFAEDSERDEAARINPDRQALGPER